MDKFFHVTGNGQRELGVCRIVAMNDGGFFYIAPVVSVGSQFQGDFSLSTGRELPRKRGRRATSAGFHAGNDELGAAFVDHNEVVADVLTTHHRIELK